MTDLDLLVAECDALAIRLLPAGDGGLIIDAPRDALTPELLARLKTHKGDVLALLGRPATPAARLPPTASCCVAAERTETVCPCGAKAWQDVPVHGGQSVRRDCGRCGRFIDFVIWHGR